MAEGGERPTRILAVDDDELILSSLDHLFTLEFDGDLRVFQQPEQAMRALECEPFDVVISDFLMPGINGVELLKEARRLQPDSPRILLTGFADKENAIRAINEAGLYQYVEKPWSNDDLLLHIRNAVSDRSLRRALREKVLAYDDLLREHAGLSDEHSRLQREIDMAARVQRSLLPAELPAGGGFEFATLYEPCEALGGDFYDVAEDGSRSALLLADVSGHGLQAALTSSLLRASFRESLHHERPEEMLRAMNARLHGFLPTGVFACATVALLERGQREVRIANAGLPYPWVVCASSRSADAVTISGMPLGLFADTEPNVYDARCLELDGGKVLMLATDGVGEAHRDGGKQFEDVGLRSTLASLAGQPMSELLAGLVAAAREHGGRESFVDDVSVLAVRVAE